MLKGSVEGYVACCVLFVFCGEKGFFVFVYMRVGCGEEGQVERFVFVLLVFFIHSLIFVVQCVLLSLFPF